MPLTRQLADSTKTQSLLPDAAGEFLFTFPDSQALRMEPLSGALTPDHGGEGPIKQSQTVSGIEDIKEGLRNDSLAASWREKGR